MKILLWNSNNGMGSQEQRDYFLSFDTDIAIIPELKEHNIEGLSPDDAIWATNNHTNKTPKGLGILAYNAWKLSEMPRDEDMEIYIPTLASKNDLQVKIMAV